MKRIFLLLAVAIITTGSLSAQVFKRQKHELSVHAGAGLSTLQYELQTGKHSNGIGFQVGGGYAFYFLPSVALRTGLEMSFYNASAKLTNFTDSYDVQASSVVNNYTYTYNIDKYNESQQSLYFNIPLMLQFQTGRTYIFYGAVGGKVGIPLTATARTKKYEIATKGYFPQEGRTYDDLPQFGFGTYEYLKGSTRLDNFKLQFMLAAEAGLKWKIRKGNDIYTGVYLDYGLNNVLDTNDKRFVTSVLSADKPPMSPIIESQYKGSPFTEKINPLAVGLRVRFTFLQ